MGGTAELKLGEIRQIALSVGDVAAAAAYYRDTLGLTPLFESEHLALFDCGPVRLLLGPAPEGPNPPGAVVYYSVDNIEAAACALAQRGTAIEAGPLMAHKDDLHELWLASFRDPDGHLLTLMEERANA